MAAVGMVQKEARGMEYSDGVRGPANRHMASRYGVTDVGGHGQGIRTFRHCATTREPVILVGLDAICCAVGAGQTAVKRWIRDEGFPARRCTDGKYRADPESVRKWFGSDRA